MDLVTPFVEMLTAAPEAAPRLEQCAFHAHGMASSTSQNAADILSYYGELRDYVKHEDSLINSRLTWSLTIDGFLFAVYAILIQQGVTTFIAIHGPTHPRQLGYLIPVLLALQVFIAIIGVVVSRYSYVAIVAAHQALQHLNAIAHGTIGGAQGLLPLATIAVVPTGGMRGKVESTVVPTSSLGSIVARRKLTIYPDAHSTTVLEGEVVSVDRVKGTFTAVFQEDHAAGRFITEPALHGRMFLPKILGGGDPGRRTGGARIYYLVIPRVIFFAWLILASASFLGLITCCVFRSILGPL